MDENNTVALKNSKVTIIFQIFTNDQAGLSFGFAVHASKSLN